MPIPRNWRFTLQKGRAIYEQNCWAVEEEKLIGLVGGPYRSGAGR